MEDDDGECGLVVGEETRSRALGLMNERAIW
ncbi:uncharacterized protein G2W53_008373 [Senna tora]|uniref:Uncharacterized protein n=1 Tax=Senna tora TaxID=362788 RepID=A0A835CEK3_9FABA|nr:uncharacterized protein G2W53_008373 [Senna tora]